MSVGDQILRRVAGPLLADCLTGEVADLRKLLILGRAPLVGPVTRAFFRRLERDLEQGGGLAALLLHIGKNASPLARRKIVENLILSWRVKGRRIRLRLRRNGLWAPFFVVVSPTMRCNLACTGCYSGLYSKDGELSEAEMDRILAECRSIGAFFVVLTGGEPYLLKEPLLRLFEKYEDLYFLTFTNGTQFDESTADRLAGLGNVAPAFSIEGNQEQTDGRRRKGAHQDVLTSMRLFRERRIPFGISVTYTRDNVDLVSSEPFVRYCTDLGAVFAWYFMFVPVGKDPILDLVPTPAQRLRCGERIAALRKRYPIFLADFWNDGPAVGGCLAGGRSYLHILNSGRVEICVFAHFGVDNIREKSILEAANSPFFRAVRAAFPYNDAGNLRRPCLIVDNPQVLRKLVQEHMVPYGHEHAQDIIEDPSIVRWIDDYAATYRELTEPDWLVTIEDPESRWYRGGSEYQKLFRFRKGAF